MNLAEGLLKTLALPYQDTGTAVSTVHTGTGNYQVADTAQTPEGLAFGTHGRAKARNLTDTSCHKGCFCIIPKTNAVYNTGTESYYIFYGAAKLYAENITACINAENLAHKNILNSLCGICII